jgi:D-alanyl-lipoteichoic acid acyltransferase DltB (MBOAT superfamily)
MVGMLGFTLQILADFSGYTDLSRGMAFLFGIETSENFARPYLSLTPSDFWNRWHMSFSFWLRDYVFFPLRRAMLKYKHLPATLAVALPPLVTMTLSGIWHGTGWTYLVWGYYGVLIAAISWRACVDERASAARRAGVGVMFAFIAFGWLIFRAPSLAWLGRLLFESPFASGPKEFTGSMIALGMIGFYALALLLKWMLDERAGQSVLLQASYYAIATLTAVVYFNSSSPDFIYFQF